MDETVRITPNEEDFDSVVFQSMSLLQTISRVYGPSDGQTMFTKMTEFLGQEVSDSVWMRLLTGEGGRQFRARISHPAPTASQSYATGNSGPNKITVIKIIREYMLDSAGGKLGLKEAKDIADQIWISELTLSTDGFERARAFKNELRAAGVQIS